MSERTAAGVISGTLAPLGLFDGWFGKGRALAAAKKCELHGDLAKAVELYVQAKDMGEAARVLTLRGDAEPDVRVRLQHYTQAARMAPKEHPMHNEARAKRANLMIALAGDMAHSAVARRDVLEAAEELLEIGEGMKAAEAYRLLGDKDGEARALAVAGDVERLEFLLSEQAADEQLARGRNEMAAEIEALLSAGSRREALALATRLAKDNRGDAKVTELERGILDRRVSGTILRVTLGSTPLVLVLGDEVTIGRNEGTLHVASSAVSREHLRIARSPGGGVTVQDLGSRNGTHLRGIKIAGAVEVHDGLELKLGGEVRIRVAPSQHLPGAVDIELGGERYVAPLGPARLGIFDWRLVRGADGWVELQASPDHTPLAETLAMAIPITLLRGDALSKTRGEAAVLQIVE